MKLSCLLVAPTAALLFLLVNVVSANAETLSADQIKKEIIGKKLGYSGAFSGDVVYSKNGKIYYTEKGKKLSGEWRFKKDKICTRYPTRIRNGNWTCFTFLKTGEGTYKNRLGYKAWRK